MRILDIISILWLALISVHVFYMPLDLLLS